MKRFKRIFHITYIVIALLVMYFSIDVLMNTEEYVSRIKLSDYLKLPRHSIIGFLLISLLMTVEFVLERYLMYKVKEEMSEKEDEILHLKDGMSEMEEEVLHLKAKLYDKSQQPEEPGKENPLEEPIEKQGSDGEKEDE